MEFLGLDYIYTPQQRVFWLYLLSAFFIAILYMRFFPKTLKEYQKRTIWWHKSAQMDYKYFMVIAFIKTVVILPLILNSKDISLWSVFSLQDEFGYRSVANISKESAVVLYTLTLFIVGDFTRYLLHRAMHSIPILWKIHQLHHSAEVLNPLTFYRTHPIENILFGIRYVVNVGLVTGVFIYFFGANIGLVEIFGANIFVFITGVFGSNLRHSHIPLRYGDFLEKLFISPYQHQLHHSKEFTHKNFGGILAIWDLFFNSLHIEKTRVNIEYGTEENISFNTITEMLFKPFYRRVEV